MELDELTLSYQSIHNSFNILKLYFTTNTQSSRNFVIEFAAHQLNLAC